MLYSSCKGTVRQIYIFFPCRQKKSCDRPEKMPLYPESPGPTDHFHSSARPVPDYFLSGFYRRRAGFCTGGSGKSSRSVDRKFSDRLPPSGYRFCNHSVRTAWHIFGILKKGYIFVVLIRNEDFLAVKRQESAAETAKCQLIQTPEYKRIKYAKGVICILIST